MAPVVWVGGAPGAGKSTVARILTCKYGLRLYAADARTWVHRDRAVAAGNPAAQRWERLGPVERWREPTAGLVAMSLHRERGPMVLDDLATLPERPLVLAEGTALPAYAADAARAVWLLPTSEFQDAQLAARGTSDGHARLYRALREVLAAEAREHGLPAVTVDGSGPVEDTVRRVEAVLAGPLHDGPHATDERERQELQQGAERGRGRAGAGLPHPDARRPGRGRAGFPLRVRRPGLRPDRTAADPGLRAPCRAHR